MLIMGSTRGDREYRRARAAYLAAALELDRVMTVWQDADVPLMPGPGGVLPAWSDAQIRASVAAARAWAVLVDRRRTLEPLVREFGGR